MDNRNTLKKFKVGDKVKFIDDGVTGRVFSYHKSKLVMVEIANKPELLELADTAFRFGKEDEIEFLTVKSDPEFEKGWESNET